ncbi:MAG TPA: hypothetical protein EYN67_03590 [Flavobacteriales bacterium]|nr:hypothetical protein [Flavobacteriales bacterium]
MKVGDLVRSLQSYNSEGGMLGIIVGWNRSPANLPHICPIVRWNDGRTSWVMQHLVKVVV